MNPKARALGQAYALSAAYLFASSTREEADAELERAKRAILRASPGSKTLFEQREFMLNLARAFLSVGMRDKAAEMARNLLKSHKIEDMRAAEALEMARFMFSQLKAYRESVPLFLAAEKKSEDRDVKALARFLLGEALYYQRDYRGAQAAWREFLARKYPEPPGHNIIEEIYHLVPNCDYQLGNYEEAAAGYRKYLEKFPGQRSRTAQTMMELADCCARSGRIEAAKERFLSLIAYLEKHKLGEKDLKLKPNVYYNYAMFLFFNARHYPEAAQAFAEFAKKFPRERRATSALFRSAECWEKMGRIEEAERILRDIQKRFTPRSLPYRKAERRLKKLQEESEKSDLK